MRRGPEIPGMFNGHIPSKNALRIVQDATALGIDPAPYVSRALAHHDQTRGGRKVIVEPGSPLGTLKAAVMAKKAER